MRTLWMCVLLLGALAAPVRADLGAATTADFSARDRGGVIVGAKGGVALAQALSPLGTSYFVEVEAGYALPFWRRLLAVTLSASFSAPGMDGSGMDGRLAGGSYTYHLDQQQLGLGLSVLAKVPLGRVVPYAGVGPRIFLVRSHLTGQGGPGAAIPETDETSMEFGLGVPVGLDVLLGPGRLFAEGQLLYAPTSQRTTGAAALGAITVALGYRFVL